MTNLAFSVSNLKDGQTLTIEPEGYSMCPFFCGYRDSVEVIKPTFPLRKGDIGIFLRKDGIYVIHRICKIKNNANETEYYFVGDNQTKVEGPIYESQIHAVVKTIIRKGKRIDCSQKSYLFLSKAWLICRPIRPILTFFMNTLLKIKNHASAR